MNLWLHLDCDEAPDGPWRAVALPSEAGSAQMLCLAAAAALGFLSSGECSLPPPRSLASPASPASPALVALLGQREELRDARNFRFWEMDRCRFLVEEPAARVSTQG